MALKHLSHLSEQLSQRVRLHAGQECVQFPHTLLLPQLSHILVAQVPQTGTLQLGHVPMSDALQVPHIAQAPSGSSNLPLSPVSSQVQNVQK